MSGAARKSCLCVDCWIPCTRRPGAFAPGEVERVAAFLGVPLAELFRTKLAVDWVEDSMFFPSDGTFVLAPAMTHSPPGEMYPRGPRLGRCVFLQDDGRCAIHPVKPMECRLDFHTDGPKIGSSRRRRIGNLWKRHRRQIAELLGRDPEPDRWDDGGDRDLLATFDKVVAEMSAEADPLRPLFERVRAYIKDRTTRAPAKGG